MELQLPHLTQQCLTQQCLSSDWRCQTSSNHPIQQRAPIRTSSFFTAYLCHYMSRCLCSPFEWNPACAPSRTRAGVVRAHAVTSSAFKRAARRLHGIQHCRQGWALAEQQQVTAPEHVIVGKRSLIAMKHGVIEGIIAARTRFTWMQAART
jgi:hypothetical protein